MTTLKMFGFWLAILGLSWSWGAHAAEHHAAGPTGGPAEAAHGFYHWYLRALDAGERHPLRDRSFEARRYLSPRLYRTLQGMSPAAQRSYLLAADERQVGWGEFAEVPSMVAENGVAIGRVKFANLRQPRHQVQVIMVQQRGNWKLEQVAPVKSRLGFRTEVSYAK